MSSGTTISIFTFGRKSTHIFRAAIQLGVAFLTAKAFDFSDRHPGNTYLGSASRTSSSLKGLIIASIFFMLFLEKVACVLIG
ncbi:Uncharacterised protein [Salmonella enterica subsp. enterica]|nr:Uncharacterised protein [Salmonella enterica subsp. enterica]